jgi:hypothetical protein
MRLKVRAEQIAVMESYAQEDFVRRIAGRLLADFPKSSVLLPTDERFTVDELPEEKLFDLVRRGIERARSHTIALESSIAAFVIIMFDVSPSFDRHRLSQVLLNDEEFEPDRRIRELVGALSDENWESIRKDYDPDGWMPEARPEERNDALPDEPPAESAPPASANVPAPAGAPADASMQETVSIRFED